jgi:hypothetical protein
VREHHFLILFLLLAREKACEVSCRDGSFLARIGRISILGNYQIEPEGEGIYSLSCSPALASSHSGPPWAIAYVIHWLALALPMLDSAASGASPAALGKRRPSDLPSPCFTQAPVSAGAFSCSCALARERHHPGMPLERHRSDSHAILRGMWVSWSSRRFQELRTP